MRPKTPRALERLAGVVVGQCLGQHALLRNPATAGTGSERAACSPLRECLGACHLLVALHVEVDLRDGPRSSKGRWRTHKQGGHSRRQQGGLQPGQQRRSVLVIARDDLCWRKPKRGTGLEQGQKRGERASH
eukprot:4145104-Prymnesium_polylepis.1